MARTVTVTCDRCPAVVREETPIVVEGKGLRRRIGLPVYDFCDACAESFKAWLAEGGRVPVPDPAAPDPELAERF